MTNEEILETNIDQIDAEYREAAQALGEMAIYANTDDLDPLIAKVPELRAYLFGDVARIDTAEAATAIARARAIHTRSAEDVRHYGMSVASRRLAGGGL